MSNSLGHRSFFERAQEAADLFLKDPMLPYVSAVGAVDIADTYIAIFTTHIDECALMMEYLMGAYLVHKGVKAGGVVGNSTFVQDISVITGKLGGVMIGNDVEGRVAR